MEELLWLLKFCLNTTYFVFRGKFFKQKHGAAVGGPVSPTCNLYMELFEPTALETAPHWPRIWLRYIDDTFDIIKKQYLDTNHINSQNEYIKFTCDLAKDSKLPFLDTVVKQSDDGSLSVLVYRKPTHTNQYLSFESHRPREHKLSVIRTLTLRAEFTITDPEDKQKELDHIKAALGTCGYKPWTFSKLWNLPYQKKKLADNYLIIIR